MPRIPPSPGWLNCCRTVLLVEMFMKSLSAAVKASVGTCFQDVPRLKGTKMVKQEQQQKETPSKNSDFRVGQGALLLRGSSEKLKMMGSMERKASPDVKSQARKLVSKKFSASSVPGAPGLSWWPKKGDTNRNRSPTRRNESKARKVKGSCTEPLSLGPASAPSQDPAIA